MHAPERPGQGRTPDREGPITFEDMVRDTLGVPRRRRDPGSAHVIGFSDGAITGLLLARDHPDRVLSLVAISGNLDPTGFVADEDATEHESGLDPQRFSKAYDRLSPNGPDHREVVLEKLGAMWTSEPQIAAASLSGVRAPTLVLAGQHDSIRTDHTLAIADAIPGAQVAIVPGAGHTVMEERPAVVNLLISEFLSSVGA